MAYKVLKYSLLKHKIIEKVNNEEYKEGDLIPSERELMDMYQMSRITVRKAIDDLVNEGYLYRIQGKGTYVRSDENSHDLFSITSCTEDISNKGMIPSSRVISSDVIKAGKHKARRLQIDENDLIFKLKRVYYADGVSINFTTTNLPLSIFPGLDKYDFSKTSLYSVIENDYGIKITHASRTLQAVLASEETAKHLDIKQGEPLILFECVTYGEVNGKELIIEVFDCCYRTDVHKFYINQVR
ncbi:MAG: GntR family transcriptional regulator [Oscillospiraceae bacterium]|nr:GntR family transcriptional regulator [Oscillospiraceae bacterium]